MRIPLFEQSVKFVLDWLNEDVKPSDTDLSDFNHVSQSVRPGDVILVQNRSRVGATIKNICSSRWSHSVLYIGRLQAIDDTVLRQSILDFYQCESDTQLVIESKLGKGVIIEALSHYEEDHTRICRPIGLSQDEVRSVVQNALSRLGNPFVPRYSWELIKFFIPWAIFPLRWRQKIFASTNGYATRAVSSNHISEAFNYIRFPILPLVKINNEENSSELFRQIPKVTLPCDFDHSPYFEIIKYPFLAKQSSRAYRLLPWKGKEFSRTEEIRRTELIDQNVSSLNTKH